MDDIKDFIETYKKKGAHIKYDDFRVPCRNINCHEEDARASNRIAAWKDGELLSSLLVCDECLAEYQNGVEQIRRKF